VIRERVSIRVILDEALTCAFGERKGKIEGLKPHCKDGFLITNPKAEIVGLVMAPREHGHVKLELGQPSRPCRAT